MEWTADGTICTVRRHGENGVIAQLFTREQGLVSGYVPGGAGQRMRPVLEPGNEVKARWRARLSDHLGTFQLELIEPRAAKVMTAPIRLSAMTSVLGLLALSLPEREVFPDLKTGVDSVLALIADPAVPVPALVAAVVQLETALLASLGYALDLEHCAATGGIDDLVYVSPKSGRAVSAAAGAPYHDKLLALPQFLLGRQAGAIDRDSAEQALSLTEYFLFEWVLSPHNRAIPAARERFCALALKALAGG